MLIDFEDISNFSKTSDYLPILNGILFVELLFIYLTLKGIFIHSKVLKYWYRHYGLLAVIADVLIIMIGFILARFLYGFFFTSFNIIFFILIAVIIQIIHDICFYFFFSFYPKGDNRMIDVFKKYAKEMGGSAILGDSIIIILSCLLASFNASSSLNTNIIHLIVLLYFLPYALND